MKELEKKLDAEFERLGVKPFIVHIRDDQMPFMSFNAITIALDYPGVQYQVLFEQVINACVLTESATTPATSLLRYFRARKIYGVAICDPRDTFSRLKGRVIAKGRLLKWLKGKLIGGVTELVPEEEYALRDRGRCRCAFVKLTPGEIAKIKAEEAKKQ